MAKSKWMVSNQMIGGERKYIAYRMLDTTQPDHSGNREYRGNYTRDRSAAQALADYLNERGDDT